MRCDVNRRIVMLFAMVMMAAATARAELRHVEIKTLGMD
jgi:hypothetical protein